MANSKQIVYLSQAQYAELIANGSITVDGVTVNYDENDIYVTPQAEPVTSVKVAGTSVTANGIANIPMGSQSSLGVVKQAGTGYSISIQNDGTLKVVGADTLTIKQANSNSSRPITPSVTHVAAFYGLAKASGDTTQAVSDNSVGTYTPEAKGAIQSMLGVSDLIATAENNLVASKAYAIGDVFTANGKLYKATAAIAADGAIITDGANANCEETSVGEGFVKRTDYATASAAGVIKVDANYGLRMGAGVTAGLLLTSGADETIIKNYANPNAPTASKRSFMPLTPSNSKAAIFYGMADLAGDVTQSSSSNAVGTYTDNAKASIKAMLGIQDGSTGTVDVTGTTPTIAAVENTRYVCGEVTSLSFTPPVSGISIVRFTSGSTVTVLTIPSTVKFPEWFDPTSLETNTIYEICVTDGIYGAVMSWAL